MASQEQDIDVRGVYTLTQSDLETIHEIEETKNYFLMNLDNIDDKDRYQTFINLLNSMQIFMESYNFNDYLKSTKIDKLSFYDIKNEAEDVQDDLDLIRYGTEIAFTIWKRALIKLGVGLPTNSFRSKKEIDTEPLQLDRYRFKVYREVS